MTGWLLIIMGFVLIGPFVFTVAERHLEMYLLFLGVATVYISGVGTVELFLSASKEPLAITCAVLVAGWVFRVSRRPFTHMIRLTVHILPSRLFVFSLVFVIGLIASVITAIIAAVLLVSIVSLLPYNRLLKIRLVILSCYSIGLGAVLTPIGEPLSTIATNRLNESFFYLFNLLGTDVIVGIVLLSIFAAVFLNPTDRDVPVHQTIEHESWWNIVSRSIKVYLFVMALTFLGAGFEPLLNPLLEDKSPTFLYWTNMISAVLDNATLASIEVSPSMDESMIRAVLMGLLISGGMLIPGNIPNIIAASKLSITSKEWARFGVPFGLVFMMIYYVLVV